MVNLTSFLILLLSVIVIDYFIRLVCGDDKDDKKGNVLIAEFKKINEAIEASIKEYERFFTEEKTKEDFIDSFYNDLPKKEPMRTEYRINFWKNNMAMIMQYGLTKNILDN